MNNNDFYGNLDRIRKLYLKQSYDEAVKIADKMDFKRLKDWKYIAMLINLYEAVGRLEDVRYFCILAYNRNLGGKKLVYKLTKVMIRLEEIDEAEELYDEYVQMAGRDNKKYELLYELKAVQGAKKSELIKILEDYMKRDLDEKYAYTLAELYAKTKQNEKCVNFCTKIIERFEAGETVEKAAALKNSILNPQSAAPVNVRQAGVNVQFGNTMPLQGEQTAPVVQPEKSAGQNTLGLNVEQILAEAGNEGFYVNGNAGNTTQNIPVQNMYTTQNIPVQNMYTTQNIPVQNMYTTQNIPVQDMYMTQAIPPQEMQMTQAIPTPQEMQMTQAIPTQQNVKPVQEEVPAIEEQPVVPLDEEDIASLEANKAKAQDVQEDTQDSANEKTVDENNADNKDNTNIAENMDVADTADVAETVETAEDIMPSDNIAATDNTGSIQIQPAAADISMGSTIRVDTEAVNAAIKEAAATMDNGSKMHMDGTQDIESTMAMVEAALADETRAAQFDARMDMPEYTEEYTAPIKEKITLRAFQPEIDKVYEIPMEVKRYFTKYSYVSGLEAQIGEFFESTKYEEKMGTSGIGNIIISGNRSSDKTTLAINIVKALNTLYPENVRKIARTNGDNINQRGIERSIGKLLGSALIIEEAGVIDRQRILELVEIMESDTQELLIILEDSESEINELLKNNPELIEKFNHRITYKQFTVNELVEMCKRYADKCQYTIDEKALLQLYLRIDEIHSSGDGVSLEDVRDVIDTAIESANRRASKKLFGGAKKKKVGDKEYIVLVESDFKE